MEKEIIKNYIYNQIQNGKFSFLPQNISSGIIYKIPSNYNLVEDGFEIAYLYLRKGSCVFTHEHETDIERYRLIEGILNINGKRVYENICTINQSHSIDRVTTDTIIETFKISKEYILQNSCQELNTATFDKVLTKSILKK